MSQSNLHRLFNPRHIAVVGASEKAGKIGNAVLKNIIPAGFSGTLLPVNPKHSTINGFTCLPSVSALEMGVIRPGVHLNASLASEMPAP